MKKNDDYFIQQYNEEGVIMSSLIQTLLQDLNELGSTMANILTAQGVNSSASDGLTTLADRINITPWATSTGTTTTLQTRYPIPADYEIKFKINTKGVQLAVADRATNWLWAWDLKTTPTLYYRPTYSTSYSTQNISSLSTNTEYTLQYANNNLKIMQGDTTLFNKNAYSSPTIGQHELYIQVHEYNKGAYFDYIKLKPL